MIGVGVLLESLSAPGEVPRIDAGFSVFPRCVLAEV